MGIKHSYIQICTFKAPTPEAITRNVNLAPSWTFDDSPISSSPINVEINLLRPTRIDRTESGADPGFREGGFLLLGRAKRGQEEVSLGV